MKSTVAASVLSTLVAQSSANECSGGYIHKANLVGLKCMGSTEDAASCNSECCELHKGTCGGLAEQGLVKCPWDQYQPQDATALNVLANKDNANTMCCKPRATCAQATCKAGWKLYTTNSAMKCSGGPETCSDIDEVCCITDAATCGGLATAAVKIPAARPASTCTGVAKGSDDAWKKTAATSATFQTTCCTAEVKCGAKPTCPAGQSAVPTPTNIACTDRHGAKSAQASDCSRDGISADARIKGSSVDELLKDLKKKAVAANYDKVVAAVQTVDGLRAARALLKDTSKIDEVKDATPAAKTLVTALVTKPSGAAPVVANPCCAADPSKCGGRAHNCLAGYVQSGFGASWAGIDATGATDDTKYTAKCCVKATTCGKITCPAGTKKKVNSAAYACPGTAESCQTTCCQADTEKCGGYLGNIQCAYGTFYEPQSWVFPGGEGATTAQSKIDAWLNKPANATNKNVNCCTERVACAVGTTTPYPTATPAAAALYSEHKKDIKHKAGKDEKPSMLWMAVGAVTGAGVLMFVQRMRSERSSGRDSYRQVISLS